MIGFAPCSSIESLANQSNLWQIEKMKQNKLTDDLFENSSMSFGEHLEELRKVLVKAALWLTAGTCIGLFFANTVVSFIERPLRAELDTFYLKQTAAKFKSINNEDPPKEMLTLMNELHVMPERVFIDRSVLENISKAQPAAQPAAQDATAAPAATDKKSPPATEKKGAGTQSETQTEPKRNPNQTSRMQLRSRWTRKLSRKTKIACGRSFRSIQ